MAPTFAYFIRVLYFSTFNESNAYQNLEKGPIIEDTILVLDPHTGSVLHSWGAYAFYMPHGLTVDHHDNVWVTDVAKHQVFKVTNLFYCVAIKVFTHYGDFLIQNYANNNTVEHN